MYKYYLFLKLEIIEIKQLGECFFVCVSVYISVLTHVPHVELKSVPQSRLRQTPLSVASLAVRRVHPRAMMGQRAPLIWLQKLQEASAWRLLTLLGGRGTVQQQTLLKSGSTGWRGQSRRGRAPPAAGGWQRGKRP